MRIEFPGDFLTLRTDEAMELAEHHIAEGTFWDFVAVLVEEKVASKVDTQLKEMKDLMELIQSQLGSGNSGGVTMQHNSSLPSPNISGVAEESPRITPKKVEVDLSLMGDFATFLARASKMEGE